MRQFYHLRAVKTGRVQERQQGDYRYILLWRRGSGENCLVVPSLRPTPHTHALLRTIAATVLLLRPRSRAIQRQLRPSATSDSMLGDESVGFRAVAGLPSNLSAPRPCCGKAGAHTLAEHVAFELRNPGKHPRHHATVRRVDLEGHAAHRNYRDVPASQPVERIKQILVERPHRLSWVTRIVSMWRACASFMTSPHAERLALIPEAVSRKTLTTS